MAEQSEEGAARWGGDTAESMLAEAFKDLQAQPEPDPLSKVELLEFADGSAVLGSAAAPLTPDGEKTLFDELHAC